MLLKVKATGVQRRKETSHNRLFTSFSSDQSYLWKKTGAEKNVADKNASTPCIYPPYQSSTKLAQHSYPKHTQS